jgi:DNA (cytosine-5)-methyltransferase 1
VVAWAIFIVSVARIGRQRVRDEALVRQHALSSRVDRIPPFFLLENMRVAGLFAGIGGFELGFSQIGFETEMLVEIDRAANAVLKARFPNADVRLDVADIAEIPPGTEILTAGFPCQNLSMAGDKSGINGTKTGVVVKMFDLIERSKVPIVVIENVYFMLQLDSGRAMQWLVERFEELGYHWAYRVVNTMGFGLPHRRRRVYLVAARHIDPRTVLFADDAPPTPKLSPDIEKHPLGFYWTEGRSGIGFTVDGIPPLKVGSSVGIPSAPAVLFSDGEVLMPSLGACERLQGFPSGWTDVGDNGLSEGSRWRMIGNAVSVPVVRWIAERIKAPGAVLDFERGPLTIGRRWPNAAWCVGSERVGLAAGDIPVEQENPSISAFRDPSWTRLSDRALDGFVNRAAEGPLRMPAGFLDAIRNAPRKPARKKRSTRHT